MWGQAEGQSFRDSLAELPAKCLMLNEQRRAALGLLLWRALNGWTTFSKPKNRQNIADSNARADCQPLIFLKRFQNLDERARHTSY
jgi:hypothetical protein